MLHGLMGIIENMSPVSGQASVAAFNAKTNCHLELQASFCSSYKSMKIPLSKKRGSSPKQEETVRSQFRLVVRKFKVEESVFGEKSF